jgi:hypothetical protein
LYGRKNTEAAIQYVAEGQGRPMAVYVAGDLRSPGRWTAPSGRGSGPVE